MPTCISAPKLLAEFVAVSGKRRMVMLEVGDRQRHSFGNVLADQVGPHQCVLGAAGRDRSGELLRVQLLAFLDQPDIGQPQPPVEYEVGVADAEHAVERAAVAADQRATLPHGSEPVDVVNQPFQRQRNHPAPSP